MLPNIKQGRLQAIFFMTIYILLFHSFQYITPLNSGDHRTTVPSCIRDKGFSCNIYKRFSTFMAHIFQISCRHFRCLRTLSVNTLIFIIQVFGTRNILFMLAENLVGKLCVGDPCVYILKWMVF